MKPYLKTLLLGLVLALFVLSPSLLFILLPR
jgi:hypothetical protein